MSITKKISALFVAFVASIAFSSQANAIPTYHFDYTCLGCSAATGHVTWDLLASPTPDDLGPSTYSFTMFNVPTIIPDGVAFFIAFYATEGGGGFDSDGILFQGPQLFEGSIDAPTFLLGTYLGNDRANGGCDGSCPATLVISNVPEPGSVALLGLGLFGLAAARRRKQ